MGIFTGTTEHCVLTARNLDMSRCLDLSTFINLPNSCHVPGKPLESL